MAEVGYLVMTENIMVVAMEVLVVPRMTLSRFQECALRALVMIEADLRVFEAGQMELLIDALLKDVILPHIFRLIKVVISEIAPSVRFNEHIEVMLSLGIVLVEGRHFVTVNNACF